MAEHLRLVGEVPEEELVEVDQTPEMVFIVAFTAGSVAVEATKEIRASEETDIEIEVTDQGANIAVLFEEMPEHWYDRELMDDMQTDEFDLAA